MLQTWKFKKSEPSDLEVEIARLFEQLKKVGPLDDTYDKMSDQIAKLYKLKEVDSKKRVSPDKMADIAANLVGILLILNFEWAHVSSSKAFSFVKSLR